MAISTDLVFLWAVVLLRMLIPLTIPRYPLPGIIAALLLDAVDQTIFQVFTTLPLDGYQSYDKALDIYYLAIAYIATLRNWTNYHAFGISRFLFYYRLAGVVLFELTQARWLLLVFPNVFEYFFIFYETYALRWDPRRLSRRALLLAAAFIWIVIKLPQEYWLHVAQMDMTDFVKETLLGYPAEISWGDILTANPLPFVLFLGALALILFLAWRWLVPRLPPADWPFSFAADAHQEPVAARNVRRVQRLLAHRLFDVELLEKTVLISLLVIIFARVLPGVQASDLELALGIGVVILLNTVISEALVRRGMAWEAALRQGVVMTAVNLPLLLLLSFLDNGRLPIYDALLFALLLSLIITLYDRYRPIYLVRFIAEY